MDLTDELNSSILFGSGYLCVVGPPSCGKSVLVLQYLVSRERHFHQKYSAVEKPPVFCMEYVSARSAAGELLGNLTQRLRPTTRRRRYSYDSTALEFGATLVQWLEAQSADSELHLVVDDADALVYESEEMDLWLSYALSSTVAHTRVVCLWFISQLPLRLSNCFRFHFVSRPDAQTVVSWLRQQFNTRQRRVTDAEAGGAALGDSSPHLRRLSSQQTNDIVLQAFQYYATRQPMCASAVSRDVRQLLQRVYEILPALLLEVLAPTTHGRETAAVKLDARHFAAAWSRHRSEGLSGPTGTDGPARSSTAVDPLVLALKQLGYSAMLLALAAFYGGAVPKKKQFHVFGASSMAGEKITRSEAKPPSTKASVLSSSSFIFSARRLAALYEAMLPMCISSIDPLEFSPVEAALQYVQAFGAWGLITPVLTQRRRSYHCWIPVSTAQQLGNALCLNLFDLIPA